VNTKELYTFKITQNKCGVFRIHTDTSKLRNSQNFVHTSQRLDMCSASHTEDVETIIQLVLNFVQNVPSDGSYGSCDSRKWILGWVIPCESVCEMHVAQLLQTLYSLTSEHTNSSVVG
jgi:hypothetical protein